MTQEIIYTSMPRGLKPGSRGFCTVASTSGMAKNLAERLEALSGYRHVYPPGDPNALLNPIVYSHLTLTVGGASYHVLSRIADAGLDYSGRTNKLAHHVVLAPGELVPAGPAWLLSESGFMETSFSGEPRLLGAGRTPPSGNGQGGVCRRWQEATGDAGWGGALAATMLAGGSADACIIFRPGMDLLPLMLEAQLLLPPSLRWEATFSAYFTHLPPATQCRWRCLLEGTAEAAKALRLRQTLVIDLCRELGPAPQNPLVEAARTGVAPSLPEPTRRTASIAAEAPPTSHGLLELDDSYELEVAPPPRAMSAGATSFPLPRKPPRRPPDQPVRQRPLWWTAGAPAIFVVALIATVSAFFVSSSRPDLPSAQRPKDNGGHKDAPDLPVDAPPGKNTDTSVTPDEVSKSAPADQLTGATPTEEHAGGSQPNEARDNNNDAGNQSSPVEQGRKKQDLLLEQAKNCSDKIVKHVEVLKQIPVNDVNSLTTWHQDLGAQEERLKEIEVQLDLGTGDIEEQIKGARQRILESRRLFSEKRFANLLVPGPNGLPPKPGPLTVGSTECPLGHIAGNGKDLRLRLLGEQQFSVAELQQRDDAWVWQVAFDNNPVAYFVLLKTSDFHFHWIPNAEHVQQASALRQCALIIDDRWTEKKDDARMLLVPIRHERALAFGKSVTLQEWSGVMLHLKVDRFDVDEKMPWHPHDLVVEEPTKTIFKFNELEKFDLRIQYEIAIDGSGPAPMVETFLREHEQSPPDWRVVTNKLKKPIEDKIGELESNLRQTHKPDQLTQPMIELNGKRIELDNIKQLVAEFRKQIGLSKVHLRVFCVLKDGDTEHELLAYVAGDGAPPEEGADNPPPAPNGGK